MFFLRDRSISHSRLSHRAQDDHIDPVGSAGHGAGAADPTAPANGSAGGYLWLPSAEYPGGGAGQGGDEVQSLGRGRVGWKGSEFVLLGG